MPLAHRSCRSAMRQRWRKARPGFSTLHSCKNFVAGRLGLRQSEFDGFAFAQTQWLPPDNAPPLRYSAVNWIDIRPSCGTRGHLTRPIHWQKVSAVEITARFSAAERLRPARDSFPAAKESKSSQGENPCPCSGQRARRRCGPTNGRPTRHSRTCRRATHDDLHF